MNSTSMRGPNGSDIIASGDDGYGLVKVVRVGDGEAWFGAHDYKAAVAMAEKLVQVTSDPGIPMRAAVVAVCPHDVPMVDRCATCDRWGGLRPLKDSYV